MNSPTEYLADAIDALFARLPKVRDGDADAIHDARVATRRIREALPVVASLVPDPEREVLKFTARKAGRALGRARDIDVAIALVEELERRTPKIASSLATVRSDLLEEQAAARRKLVRKVDELPLQETRAARQRLTKRFGWPRLSNPFDSGGRRTLLTAVRDQAGSLQSSVVHGSGVYFPRRSHSTRVDVKKLRYLLEIGQPYISVRPRRIELLKKTQNLLGKLHDREVLRKRVERDQTADSPLPILLQAECATLYSQYLRRRDAILELCAELELATHSPSRSRHGIRSAVIGAGAMAAAAWILTERAEETRSSSEKPGFVPELSIVGR